MNDVQSKIINTKGDFLINNLVTKEYSTIEILEGLLKVNKIEIASLYYALNYIDSNINLLSDDMLENYKNFVYICVDKNVSKNLNVLKHIENMQNISFDEMDFYIKDTYIPFSSNIQPRKKNETSKLDKLKSTLKYQGLSDGFMMKEKPIEINASFVYQFRDKIFTEDEVNSIFIEHFYRADNDILFMFDKEYKGIDHIFRDFQIRDLMRIDIKKLVDIIFEENPKNLLPLFERMSFDLKQKIKLELNISNIFKDLFDQKIDFPIDTELLSEYTQNNLNILETIKITDENKVLLLNIDLINKDNINDFKNYKDLILYILNNSENEWTTSTVYYDEDGEETSNDDGVPMKVFKNNKPILDERLSMVENILVTYFINRFDPINDDMLKYIGENLLKLDVEKIGSLNFEQIKKIINFFLEYDNENKFLDVSEKKVKNLSGIFVNPNVSSNEIKQYINSFKKNKDVLGFLFSNFVLKKYLENAEANEVVKYLSDPKNEKKHNVNIKDFYRNPVGQREFCEYLNINNFLDYDFIFSESKDLKKNNFLNLLFLEYSNDIDDKTAHLPQIFKSDFGVKNSFVENLDKESLLLERAKYLKNLIVKYPKEMMYMHIYKDNFIRQDNKTTGSEILTKAISLMNDDEINNFINLDITDTLNNNLSISRKAAILNRNAYEIMESEILLSLLEEKYKNRSERDLQSFIKFFNFIKLHKSSLTSNDLTSLDYKWLNIKRDSRFENVSEIADAMKVVRDIVKEKDFFNNLINKESFLNIEPFMKEFILQDKFNKSKTSDISLKRKKV